VQDAFSHLWPQLRAIRTQRTAAPAHAR
jgi:hypothetical protein